MIVGAAVCPGAPFLIDGSAAAIAHRLQPVVSACAEAISRLPVADTVLLVTAAPPPPANTGTVGAGSGQSVGPGWTLLVPGTLVSSAPLRRSDQPDHRGIALSRGIAVEPAGWQGEDQPLSVGTIVGAQLLAERPTPVPPTTAVQITGDPAGAAAMLAGRAQSKGRIAVLVIADGSACHGDDAPGRRDDRAPSFDAALAFALGAGDPAALAAVTRQRELAGELLAVVDPLAVLASLTVSAPPNAADLLYSGAPLGVGYLVASWRWSPT